MPHDDLTKRLSAVLSGIKSRCTNPNQPDYRYYGGRGIKANLTLVEIRTLWDRDDASSLDQPTIDRIDNDGDYIFGNCRFIERSENSSRKAENPRPYTPLSPEQKAFKRRNLCLEFVECEWCRVKFQQVKEGQRFCIPNHAKYASRARIIEDARKYRAMTQVTK